MDEIKEPLLNFWYRALHSAIGIEVSCGNAQNTISALYKARQEAYDDDLKQITLRVSPFDPTRVWLVKRKPDHETP